MPLDIAGAADALRGQFGAEPFEAALVLGSGLGGFVETVEDHVIVPFETAPGFPPSAVAGHAGRWVGGWLEGRRILVQEGRYHAYEGLPTDVVHAPVRVAAALGAPVLVLTNAAGGVRRAFAPGTLVVLENHLDLMEGIRHGMDGFGGGAAMGAYDAELGRLARRSAREVGIPLECGVYAAVSGPSYETPAEIRMLDRMGADLVGMSTVPEVTAAHAAGLRTLALSLVTNRAAGIARAPLDHDDVIETGRAQAAILERLLRAIVRGLPIP